MKGLRHRVGGLSVGSRGPAGGPGAVREMEREREMEMERVRVRVGWPGG